MNLSLSRLAVIDKDNVLQFEGLWNPGCMELLGPCFGLPLCASNLYDSWHGFICQYVYVAWLHMVIGVGLTNSVLSDARQAASKAHQHS